MTTTEIQRVLDGYIQALANADGDGVARHYLEDGIFMPRKAPTRIGRKAISSHFEIVFRKVEINFPPFSIDELIDAGDWLFARTNGKGTVRVKESGQSFTEANKQLIIFGKAPDNTWKIARFCINDDPV